MKKLQIKTLLNKYMNGRGMYSDNYFMEKVSDREIKIVNNLNDIEMKKHYFHFIFNTKTKLWELLEGTLEDDSSISRGVAMIMSFKLNGRDFSGFPEQWAYTSYKWHIPLYEPEESEE